MLTAKQHENIARGMRRIKKAAERAYIFTYCHYLDGRGTYFSNRFKKL